MSDRALDCLYGSIISIKATSRREECCYQIPRFSKHLHKLSGWRSCSAIERWVLPFRSLNFEAKSFFAVLENYSQDIHMSLLPSSPVLHPCWLFDSDCLSSQILISPFGSPTRVSNFPLPSFSKQMDIFMPYILDISQKTYYILPILPSLPSLPQPDSSHYLIISSPTAYTPQVLPTFKKSETNWQSIFSKVTNPVQLWDCYAPRSLGDYPDVKTIWQSWSEGTAG